MSDDGPSTDIRFPSKRPKLQDLWKRMTDLSAEHRNDRGGVKAAAHFNPDGSRK